MLRIFSFLALALWAGAALAQTLSGEARVIDGDGLELAGEKIRLFGIDAPELSQTCSRGGSTWACGVWSAETLRQKLSGEIVTCIGHQRDRYDRLLATCALNGQDIAHDLVRAGVVFAYPEYSGDYVADEKAAAVAGLGVWAGEAERPAAFRGKLPPNDDQTGANPTGATGCAIKGNISGSGRIYHVPGNVDYARTRIDTRAGERWFCSAGEARDAGWRAARR